MRRESKERGGMHTEADSRTCDCRYVIHSRWVYIFYLRGRLLLRIEMYCGFGLEISYGECFVVWGRCEFIFFCSSDSFTVGLVWGLGLFC